ncbi:hypothetical protein TRIUR3_24017 [Triticum urartu]|uniref:Uncharacterized protein n=1 Tax=Triticum urartu TaxID=4572 RepID=M7ZL26_TRIUA|nr:hypothetical protein TRIUR3_24017 [Triticum urartu]
MVVPRDATLPFDYTRVFQQVVREGQSVIIEEGEEEQVTSVRDVVSWSSWSCWSAFLSVSWFLLEQVESPHAKDAPPGKEKEKKLPQVKVRPRSGKGKSLWSRLKNKEKKLPQVKVRPRPEKGKSLWSRLKNKIFCREGRQICSEREEHQIFRREGKQIYSRHVEHQTRPINEVRNRYMVSSNEANHLDAYSEIRLEQVIDRQDTDEEHRLLHVVERMSVQHAILGWNSEFSRTSREMHNCLTVVECRHSFTQCWHKLKFEAYYEVNNPIAFEELIEKVMRWKGTESTSRFLILMVFCNSIKWCFEHVIPARVDADHVMLVALATALEVPLRTESFQQGYARDIYTGPGFPRPSVTLLYTGNHYNIIYPRAPSAESSSHQASKREEPAGQS